MITQWGDAVQGGPGGMELMHSLQKELLGGNGSLWGSFR